MTKANKRVLVCLILTVLFSLAGCGSKAPVGGFYMADHELQYAYLEGWTYTPFVRIETREGHLSGLAYGPGHEISGFHTVEGDVLTIEGWGMDATLYFEIIDSKTLKLVDASVDEDFLKNGTTEGVHFGDVFYWTEPLPEE